MMEDSSKSLLKTTSLDYDPEEAGGTITAATSAALSTSPTTQQRGSILFHSDRGNNHSQRFNQAIREMNQVCPNAMSLYASCALGGGGDDYDDSQTSSNSRTSMQESRRGSKCNKEFHKVKECFRKTQGM